MHDDGWVHQWHAPGACRAIDLVSDLHLDESAPRTAEAFLRWLRETTADAVFLLGDVFEAWIGDDVEPGSFEAEVLQHLGAASQRLTVGFMVGNRDFLLRPAALTSRGVMALGDPLLVSAFGQTVAMVHGDAQCVDDLAYQRFRAQVRQAAWQQAFLAQPRSERAAAARAMRDASRQHQLAAGDGSAASNERAGMAITDIEPTAAIALMASLGVDTLIHGHTHQPATHRPAVRGASASTTRHVLSDWDLDTTASRQRA
jgi:UDP-2,3-diacylglucosamine hydrolase